MNLAPSTAPASPMVVNCVAYDRHGKRLPPLEIEQISDVLRQEDSFVWVGLHEPTEAMLEKLQEEFGLHDLAVEDAHHAHQRPKIEVYGDSLFLVLHTAQEVNCRIEFGETHIFLGPRYLLTVRHGASLSYAPARARCEREPEMFACGPSYALYAVLDFVIDNFQPIVRSFKDELAALESAIFEHDFNRDTIARLYELKKELVTLRLAISPMQDILNQLVRFHASLIKEEVRPYFRDVYDHVVRVKEASDTMSEMLTAAMSVMSSVDSPSIFTTRSPGSSPAIKAGVPGSGVTIVSHFSRIVISMPSPPNSPSVSTCISLYMSGSMNWLCGSSESSIPFKAP